MMYTQNECSNQGMFNDSRSDVPNGYFHFQPQLRKCLFFGLFVGGERTGRESPTNGAGGKEEVGFTVISAQCLDELRTNPKFQ